MNASTTVAASRSGSARPFIAGVMCFAAYFGARAVLEMQTLAPGWRLAAALAPVPLFVWALVEVVRAARQLDEMQRRIHLEALAIAYPLVLTMLMALGLLELAVPLNKEDWSYRHVWQMQGVLYLLCLFITQRRYGVTGK
jgi:hypothetical protein